MTFEVKKGIVPPKRVFRDYTKYPFKNMDIGDHFDMPLINRSFSSPEQTNIHQALNHGRKRGTYPPNFKISARTIELDNERVILRIWRIA